MSIAGQVSATASWAYASLQSTRANPGTIRWYKVTLAVGVAGVVALSFEKSGGNSSFEIVVYALLSLIGLFAASSAILIVVRIYQYAPSLSRGRVLLSSTVALVLLLSALGVGHFSFTELDREDTDYIAGKPVDGESPEDSIAVSSAGDRFDVRSVQVAQDEDKMRIAATIVNATQAPIVVDYAEVTFATDAVCMSGGGVRGFRLDGPIRSGQQQGDLSASLVATSGPLEGLPIEARVHSLISCGKSGDLPFSVGFMANLSLGPQEIWTLVLEVPRTLVYDSSYIAGGATATVARPVSVIDINDEGFFVSVHAYDFSNDDFSQGGWAPSR